MIKASPRANFGGILPDALLASLEDAIPQMLDELPPEDRNRIYKMLSLKVEAIPEGPLKLTGSFVRGWACALPEPQDTRYSHPRVHR